MFITWRTTILLVIFVFRANCNDEDEADRALESMNFAEFKERYRRLIPYITYFVANNYANSQVSEGLERDYEGETSASQLTTKPQQHPVPAVDPRDPSSRTLNKQRAKFVASVQYDPKDIADGGQYFAPVAYDSINYADPRLKNRQKGHERQRYSGPNARPEMSIFHHENLRYPEQGSSSSSSSSSLSSRPYNLISEEKYLPHESHRDHPLDEWKIPRGRIPMLNNDHNYPIDFEPVRHYRVKPQLRRGQKPTSILAQSVPQRPSLQRLEPIYSSTRNPSTSLEDITKSIQLTNRLPESLDKNNIESSIKTLVEILGILNNGKQVGFSRLPVIIPRDYDYDDFDKIHKPPRVVTEERFQATPKPRVITKGEQTLGYVYQPGFGTNNIHTHFNPYYEIVTNVTSDNVIEHDGSLIRDDDRSYIVERPVKLETQHGYEIGEDLEDDLSGNYREKPQLAPPTSLVIGATRGKPNVDYPAHSVIPETEFNCKQQRYKGFFGDPSTGCQVWHYCDLNGGKSSFLCPNGTIFNQVALTCDWWFNVKCESTTQLYVLNERLYKYILPVMPKFPEDFSGPEVDRYLELKFKEMEAKLREKKRKKQQERGKLKEKLLPPNSED